MKVKSTLFFVIILMTQWGYAQTPYSFLKGTWKVEGKEMFESWEETSHGSMVGSSYKMENDQKKIIESLAIKQFDGAVIYQATVPDQNQGQTINFTLNTKSKDKLSFENLEHDFPKKIQYTQLNEATIFVEVLGKNDEGFSFRMVRVRN